MNSTTKTTQPRKVIVTTVVMLDLDEWNTEYGADESLEQARRSIQLRVEEAAQEAFQHITHAVQVVNR